MTEEHQDNDRTESYVPVVKGTVISHYKIVEKIGAGGMGEVYLAEDTELNRSVALKFLPPHLCQDEDCRARFKREAQAAAKLSHPNIVTIYEVGEYNGRPFFAMELVEGQSLREYARARQVPVERVVDLAIQICDGLSVAHEKKIVHRDIKPSNIIIDAYGRPRILDFGLATVQGEEHLTRTGSTLGTVGYMSPEQAEGREVDHRSDLFSFGVVLYELITGRNPFSRENDMATGQAIISYTPEPLAKYCSDIPAGLQSIIDKALDKDIETRYQTASGFSADLKREKKTSVSAITPIPSMAPAPAQKRSSAWLIFAGIGVLAVIAAVALVTFWPEQQAADNGERKSLAVLPFANLGSPEDKYFADGMTDEITARLAGIQALRVTSRTSAIKYRNTDKSVRVIGKELGVDYLLEGTIRWDKSGDIDRVRIIPQLIRVSDDSHIWAGTFERALTQVFAAQADIATQIANALDITLLEPERQSIKTELTQNLEAYHYFLRGKEYWEETRRSDRATEMFENAVELDSSFYQAYQMLAQIYGYQYINDLCETDRCVQQAKDAAEKAFRLARGRPEGHLAMGYFHYYCSRDYDRALEQFEKALEGQPNNSELLAAIGYVQRRQGRWGQALANLQKCVEMDPRNLSSVDSYVRTLFYLHRCDEARKLIEDALKWAPDSEVMLTWKMFLVLITEGDFTKARAALNELDRYAERSYFSFWSEKVDIYLRDYRSALMRRTDPGEYKFGDSSEFYSSKGDIYRFLGENALSRTYFDSARIICEKRVQMQPGNAWFHADLAVAYAGLGRRQKALEEGRKAADLMPVSKDALNGVEILQSLAVVYVMVGENESAIDLLEFLLKNPSAVQVGAVRLYPFWDPLRDHPRFQALMEKYKSQ